MATPFTLSGELLLPVDPGQPNSIVAFSLADQFNHKVDYEFSYTGSATESVSLGTLASGAKAIVLEFDFDPAADPINIRFNGGGSSGQMEISSGGFYVFGSPAPSSGITTLDIVHTTDVKVRLRVLG